MWHLVRRCPTIHFKHHLSNPKQNFHKQIDRIPYNKPKKMEIEPEKNKAPSNPLVTIGNEEFTVVKEGRASVLFKGTEVFYNPVQEVNRDLSILFIKLYIEQLEKERKEIKNSNNGSEGVKILEALSATGLRSIRYMKEIEGISSIIANDIDVTAVEAIKRNILFNDISESKIIASHSDAISYMYANRDVSKQFDIVDLDPYGGANIFLDGAIQCIKDGGLLCVTCTDMAVLCGSYTETCYVKYNSVPLHGKYCHEMALRILLASISNHASVYKRYIVPVVSLSIDFYIRIFVRVYTSPGEVRKLFTKLGNIYQCIACDSFHIVPLGKVTSNEKGDKFSPSTLTIESHKCSTCERPLKVGGPIWIDPIHDNSFVERSLEHITKNSNLYNQSKKVFGLLTVAKEELPTSPLYYSLSSMCNTVHCSQPPFHTFKSAILNAGYKASATHASPDGFKTNAPNSVLWDIVRKWVQLNPVKNISDTSPAHTILAKSPSIDVNFTLRQDAKTDKTIPRFLPNPREHWGPGSKAKKRCLSKYYKYILIHYRSIDPEKAKKNQGKNKKKREFQKKEEIKDEDVLINE
jgi:tRNA (guanine26-N2/guanine27-N2)-dimethyltransferase